MTTATKMYAQSLDQIANAIKQGGHKRTVLVEGHMGTGKSSLLKMLAEELPNHSPCYFDCTTKDLGDITIPRLIDGTPEDTEARGYVQYYTNEELGAHLNKPIILMVDEYGKANPSVRNALMRPMLERAIGSYQLHPDSIVFATTNMGGENVGDVLLNHQRNRITIVQSRKPTNEEWIVNFGIPNNLHPTILSWAKDTPQLFQSYDEVQDPDDNPYIFHPLEQRDSFVTPRSLHAASDWLWCRDEMDDHSLTSCLIGTIGARGAMDLMGYVALADKMPKLQDIKDDPRNALVPDTAAGVCMVVFRTLGALEKDWIDAWMVYLERLSVEAQGMFVNGVRSPKYHKQAVVMTNKKFTEWAMKHNFLFSADKR